MSDDNEKKISLDFKRIFESVPDLYLVLDSQLNIVEASDAFLKATLVTRSDVIGKLVFDVFPDNPNDPTANGVNILRASLQRVLRNKKPDNMGILKYDIMNPNLADNKFEERYWQPINIPIIGKNNEVQYIVNRSEDVTELVHLKKLKKEQTQLTQALQVKTGEMEIEIGQRAQALQSANDQLQSAFRKLEKKKKIQGKLFKKLKEYDQLKTQFFSNISHELRTPLALILGPVGSLKSKDSIVGKDRHLLDLIDKNANILLKHVNDLLDIAKLDAGKLLPHYEEINLSTFIRMTAENFSSLAEERHIHFLIETPAFLKIQIDPEKLQRIVLNLLANAFKFVPDGGKITCSLKSKENKAVLIVSDNGPGIPESLRDVIFERFQQVDGTAKKQLGGTGLGLAIVKDFVEMQKGNIQVEETPGGGAEFQVEMPLLAPAGVKINKPLESSEKYIKEMSKATVLELKPISKENTLLLHQANKPSILVVEDNFEMNQFIVGMLTTDFNVIAAKNGKEGFQEAINHKPDLIISDMMMPEMSGEEMVCKIRQHAELNDTPIILLSAKADEELRLKLLQESVQDYILKPFSEEELKARVSNLINLKKAKNDLEQKNIELKQMAYFDALTGLANRSQLLEKIKLALSTLDPQQSKIAILFLDLDRFKLINDTLGHKIGDTLLQRIAKRLKSVIQDKDVAARLGGDEFVIMLDNLTDESAVNKVAHNVLKEIKKPILINNHKLYVTSSIGISICPQDGVDEQTLLKHADIAMYYAKQLGRNNYQLFTSDMANRMKDKMQIENILRVAIENNNFILHYQPQIDLSIGGISSIEALLRLTLDDGTVLYPNKFLSIADETGLIVPIGEWVLETACLHYKKWLMDKGHHLYNGLPIRLAINFSSRQLEERDFIHMVERVLEKTQIEPHYLEFEITENPLIRSMETSKNIIKKLKDLGVHIALDDFGVGFSSLNYLRQFPLDTLKLDQSLMRNVPADQVNSSIVTSIINMAHAIGISIVAEGIETESQIQFLQEKRCNRIQGYYFSKPLLIEEIVPLIHKKWYSHEEIES